MMPFVVKHVKTGTKLVVLGRAAVGGSMLLCASKKDGHITRIPEHAILKNFEFLKVLR